MAVRHPQLVRALFLQEPLLSSVSTEFGDQKLVRELGERLAEAHAAAKASDLLRAARIFVDSVNGQPGGFDAAPPAVKVMQIENMRTERLSAPRHMSTNCAQLGQLKVPVTITKGQRTPAVFSVIAERVHLCIPGSQLMTIPNASHSAPRQNPSAFNEALLAFLARNSSAQTQTPKQVSVNNTTLTYVDEGTGPVVVFVHGAYSDHRIWEIQREVVSKGYRYVALDLRYFGTAPWSDNGKNFNVATHAADVAAFIRALKVGPVHLVGRSYGAITSLAVAIRHPGLVRGLFLNEPGIASAVTNAEEQKLLTEDRKCIQPVAAAANTGNDAEAVKLFFECTHNQPGAYDSLPSTRRAMLLDNARTVALQVDPAAAPRITCAQLGEIKVPVEITRGELTRPFYRITVGAVHRCIPGSRLITIKGATHGAPSQQPAAFNEALVAFLARTNVRLLRVNGYDMADVERSTGEPVVLLHGGLSDYRQFSALIELLSAKYRVIAPSRRHHYPERWEGKTGNASTRQHVADLVAFLRKLNAGRVHLVGHSRGADVALYVATKHPELVRTLTILEGGGGAPRAW